MKGIFLCDYVKLASVYVSDNKAKLAIRWFGTLEILFAIFAIFSNVKPISLLITLIPKNIYLTMHSEKYRLFVTMCHFINNVLI